MQPGRERRKRNCQYGAHGHAQPHSSKRKCPSERSRERTPVPCNQEIKHREKQSVKNRLKTDLLHAIAGEMKGPDRKQRDHICGQSRAEEQHQVFVRPECFLLAHESLSMSAAASSGIISSWCPVMAN